MANVYDFLGDNKDLFMHSSLKVYTDLSGAMQYVGKTENEKTIKMSPEYIDWWDNTTGMQTPSVKDLEKIGVAIDFMFKQVADPNALAIAFNTDWDQSNPNYHYEFFGSEPNALATAKWVFIGRTVSGLDVELWIRKGVITLNGDWSLGAPGSYTGVPVTCSALQDTSITNTKRDIAYIRIQKQTPAS